MEATLEDLGDQVKSIAKSRFDLIGGRPEQTADDETLLDSLVADQKELEYRQEHLQQLLVNASQEHGKITQALIDRLDAFQNEDRAGKATQAHSLCILTYLVGYLLLD